MRRPKENNICIYCGSQAVKKNGRCNNIQRYICNSCSRTFSKEGKRIYSDEQKAKAITFYLNNCGVRKTALFVGCSPATVINWVRAASDEVQRKQSLPKPTSCESADIIEMDEIYTTCLKKPTK